METSEKLVYHIELTHTDEDCKHALQQLQVNGFLSHFEWGCKDGVHVGFYRMVTDDARDPLRILPTYVRDRARIIRLRHISPQDLAAAHR